MSTLSAFHLHRNVSSEKESLELYFLKSSFPYFILFFNTSLFQTRCHQNVRFQMNKVEDKIPPEDYTVKSLRFWSMYKIPFFNFVILYCGIAQNVTSVLSNRIDNLARKRNLDYKILALIKIP